jgi:hypothetical protein
MLDKGFEDFLYADPQIESDKAVASRMTRARNAEGILGTSLDVIVASDNSMYDALIRLKENGDTRGNIQNAVRKYYIYKNGTEFPQLRYYLR